MKVITFLIFFSTYVFSGNEIGNGGNYALDTCTNKAYFYDLYEMKVLYNWEPDLSSIDPRTEVTIAQGLINRLAKFDSKVESELNEWTKEFYHQVLFSELPLPPIPDFYKRISQDGVIVEQLIIQEDYRYHIFVPAWKRLDNINKAAAIVHEVIYRKALLVNPHLFRSDLVRLITQLLLIDANYPILMNNLLDRVLRDNGQSDYYLQRASPHSPVIRHYKRECH